LAHEGDKVREGQLLLELDDSDARAQLARAVAQLRTAEATAEAIKSGGTHEELITRQAEVTKSKADLDSAARNLQALEKLQQRGAASPEEVAAAKERLSRAQADSQLLEQKNSGRYSTMEQSRWTAEVEQARAAVRAAQDLLASTNVRSPFTGTVYNIPARQGAFVNVGDLLLQMADLSQMQVRAFVDEPDIARVRPDQEVRISWEAMPDKTWTGRVRSTPLTVVSRGNRMVGELLCTVDDSNDKLFPNTNVNATIITSSRPDALTVPREALREENGKAYVYIVRDGHLRKQDVTTGVTSLTRVEIIGGLKDNDVLATDSLSQLPMTDGAPVQVSENPA
jgi:HlyD family secretion protein